MSYLDSRLEAKSFVDSLKKFGIDTVLTYHKKHGYSREYFIFWVTKSELQLRKINSTVIFEIGDWSFNSFYRGNRIFTFYINHQTEIKTADLFETMVFKKNDSITLIAALPSHYPYVDIDITIDTSRCSLHLPYGVNSDLDNSAFHLVRLIESTIYNLENTSYWSEAERKIKLYPKRYDPQKKKWQNWERENGKIWDDYYH